MEIGKPGGRPQAVPGSASSSGSSSGGFDIEAYIDSRLGKYDMTPSNLIAPRSFDQAIEPFSCNFPRSSRYYQPSSIDSNDKVTPVVYKVVRNESENKRVFKFENLRFSQEDLERTLILSHQKQSIMGMGGSQYHLQQQQQQQLQQQRIQIKGLGPSSGSMQSNHSQSNANSGLNLALSRVGGSTNNLNSMSIMAGSGLSTQSSVQAASSAIATKRQVVDDGDLLNTNAKKLRATQSSSNVQAMQQPNNSMGVGANSTSAAHTSDMSNIAYTDLKVIMKLICDEFWNYDYGSLEIKKAFRSKLNNLTCKALCGLDSYAVEDSSLVVIRERIHTHYRNTVEFETDFRLMFFNLIKYFPKSHPVSEVAKKLQGHFEMRWAAEKAKFSR